MSGASPYTVGPSYLRIVFPAPGFFLNDTRLRVTVDGYPALDASFTQGFDWWTEAQPGVHAVETSIAAPLGFARKKSYQLEVRPGLVTLAVLEYSRIWGNLTDAPRVSFVPR